MFLCDIYMYRSKKKSFVKIRGSCDTSFSRAKNLGGPLGPKKLLQNLALLYSKRPAKPHGFNEANGKLIRVQESEILPKNGLKFDSSV